MWMHKKDPGMNLAFINTAFSFVYKFGANQLNWPSGSL